MCRKVFKLIVILTVACCVSILSGCDNSIDIDGVEVGTPMKAAINIQFNFGSQTRSLSNPPATRFDETTSGTNEESTLQSLSLFLVDYIDGIEMKSTAQVFRFSGNLPGFKTDGTALDPYTAVISTTSGSKRMYIAANLTLGQQAELLNQYRANGTSAVISGISADFCNDSDNKGFAMFSDSWQDFVIEPQSGTYPQTGSFKYTLERLVSKVLLTANLYEDNIFLKIGNEAVGENGWIRMSEVKYLLNATNTKVYPYPLVDATKKRIDPNHNISSSVTTDFSYIDEATVISNGKTIVAYDENRMPGGSGNVYTGGIYCLENLVNNDNSSDEATIRQYTTHAIVAVRYTPRHIYVLENGTIVRKSYVNDTDAQAAIKAQSDDKSKATHYTLNSDKRMMYTYEAAIKEDINNFTKYDDGWHYYNTFIGGTKDVTGKLAFDNTQSSLVRNHYYFLRISSIDIVNGPLIEFKTTILPWEKQDVEQWFSSTIATITPFFEVDNYSKGKNPDGIPVNYNILNTIPSGTDLYNLTFKLRLEGQTGTEWRAVLSNPSDFGLYVEESANCVANGTITNTTANTGDATIQEYKIAVYARSPYSHTSRTTQLSIVVDGMREISNRAEGNDAMPGTQQQILIKQQ